jgi:hypothetical protein
VATSLKHLYVPRPAQVAVGEGGAPREVDGVAVGGVREEWEVLDRWWAPPAIHRRYFELALADGRAVVVFRTGRPVGRWYRQRA